MSKQSVWLDTHSIPGVTSSRLVGVVDTEARTIRKKVKGSEHQLRRPPAWAWAVEAIERARQAGCLWLEVEDTEANATWRASLACLDEHGFPLDRGFGAQVGLELGWWTPVKAGNMVQASMGI
jgi:hypothetical protein